MFWSIPHRGDFGGALWGDFFIIRTMVVLINGGGRLWSKMMYNVKDIYLWA
jgi:hypothetical protein